MFGHSLLPLHCGIAGSFSACETTEATDSQSTNICLRVLDPKNKKSIKDSYQLNEITCVGSVGDFKAYIIKTYGEQTGAADQANFDLGYYGPPRGTRFRITSDAELAKALSLKKDGWVLLWMVVQPQTKAPKCAGDSRDYNCAPGCSDPKAQCLDGKCCMIHDSNSCFLVTTLKQTYLPLVTDEKSYDSILEHLTIRHGGKIPQFKLKVWARMLVSVKITLR